MQESAPRPPKFSIIVGIYNHEEHLPLLLRSLNEQVYKNFEVHFCDDGSTDDSREIIENYNIDFPWTYHYQKNKGMRLAKSLNRGIKAARGEYCVLIMGDSFPEIEYLQTLEKCVNPDSIVCGVRVHVEGKKLVELDYRLRKGLIPQEPVLLVSHAYQLITGNGLTIPTDAFREHGLLDEKIAGYGGEDTEITARLYYKGYLFWSVPSLILYHNYHHNKETKKENMAHVNKVVNQYAS